MDEDVLGRESFLGFFPEQTSDQTFGSGRKTVRKTEVTSTDFGEESRVFLAVKRISGKKEEGKIVERFCFVFETRSHNELIRVE